MQLAYSKRHEYVVALKIVSKFQESTDFIDKFLFREIEVVKGLRHKNILRYYQAIETTHR